MLANKVMGATSAAPDLNYIEDVFSTYLYTGNGANPAINNGIDLAGEGGLVWIKGRAGPDPFGYERHVLHDSQRGVGFRLSSNLTNAQASEPQDILSFNANGFTLGGGGRANDPATTYASWTFRKQPKFFDVVTFTAPASGSLTVNHNLGSTPGFITIKRTDLGSSWITYHRSTGAGKYLSLNTTNAAATFAPIWANVTSTSFQVSVDAEVDANGTYVAYLFAHDAGGFGLSGNENVVSCGSFVSGSPGSVTLGYEPQWLLIKRTDDSTYGNWYLIDAMRGLTGSGSGNSAFLYANAADAEYAASINVHATATGFTESLFTGGTYIYIAIRRGPMKVPTLGTTVFDVQFEGNVPDSKKPGTRSSTGYVDMGIRAYRPGGIAGWPQWWSRLTDTEFLTSTTNAAAVTGNPQQFDYSNGWLSNTYASTVTSQIDYMFKRAPSFFDVVCYTGTGVARTVAHNLGVAPELIMVKSRSAATYGEVYAAPVGNTKYMYMAFDQAASTGSSSWNNTSPTSTDFTVGVDGFVNANGVTFVAWMFATCAGVSKVGSYTGTGTTQAIACGFAAGARFVMIKRTDAAGDWYIWDSARGIVAGNDPYLLLNTTGAETTGTDYIDPSSTGFEISSTAPAAINASGGSYIFLAVA